jgi:hypothetical protein
VARIKNVLFSFRFVLSFLLILSACGQKPEHSSLDPDTQELAAQARSLSLAWLSEASLSGEDAATRIAAVEIASILREAPILAPPAVYADECEAQSGKFVAAFVTQTSREAPIYICSESKRLGKVYLAQVFIHEALHLLGDNDECTTTQLELKLMAAAFRTPYQNSYVRPCGLEEMI